MAIYAASKALEQFFTEALSEETRERGVRVLALCPGPVQTAFFDVVGTRLAAVGPWRRRRQWCCEASRPWTRAGHRWCPGGATGGRPTRRSSRRAG
ncbi:SDR family NAD(P)-dependent oxidoreductase [Corallococcus sp. EGB]|uniref:SDR family NAD(P)-dependent oxidoreductase n=1 Tax=Corallococcus sp. EGB TaxID=1521117 RepID=UPI001CBE7461